MVTTTNETLLEVEDLQMYFPVTSGIVFQQKVADVKAVDGVSFTLQKGETLGLVGESGCGKTTAGRTILQLYKPTGGSIKFNGTESTLPALFLLPFSTMLDLYLSQNRMCCKIL